MRIADITGDVATRDVGVGVGKAITGSSPDDS